MFYGVTNTVIAFGDPHHSCHQCEVCERCLLILGTVFFGITVILYVPLVSISILFS